jgi:F-type H+-transporting ATPase subunit alpha
MQGIRADEISKIIRQQIEGYSTAVEVSEVGQIISAGDGIAEIYGLEKVMAGELLDLPHEVAGIALNLEEDKVGAVLFGDTQKIKGGDEVRRTKRIIVPVGDQLIAAL